MRILRSQTHRLDFRNVARCIADELPLVANKPLPLVVGGTLQLANGAVYGGGATNPSFTLNSGATLLADAHSNGIRANTIKLDSGSILEFDMAGALLNGATTNLVLDGTVDASGQKVGEGTVKVTNMIFYGREAGDRITLVDAGIIGQTDASGSLLIDPLTQMGSGNAGLAIDGSG